MRTCVVNLNTSLVENVIDLGVAGAVAAEAAKVEENTTAPSGYAYVQSDIAQIGWSYASGTLSPPPDMRPLSQVQATKLAELEAAYASAIARPVAYLGTTFQADPDSQDTLSKVLAALTPAGATPSGFYWVDANNNQVAMTLAQLQGLAAAMMAQGWTAFQNLQTKKAAVRAAATIDAVNAITW